MESKDLREEELVQQITEHMHEILEEVNPIIREQVLEEVKKRLEMDEEQRRRIHEANVLEIARSINWPMTQMSLANAPPYPGSYGIQAWQRPHLERFQNIIARQSPFEYTILPE